MTSPDDTRTDFSAFPPVLLFGAGKMGGAMLSGWISRGLRPDRLAIVDPYPNDMMIDLAKQGAKINPHPANFDAGMIVLAVKPQMVDAIWDDLTARVRPDTLILSVLAGTRLERLGQGLPPTQPIMRVMPNTPSAIGQGMSVLCPNAHVDRPSCDRAQAMMAAIGKTAWIEDETLMDAVTAVSGSGPAYVFYLTECLARAGVEAGLPADLADQLARQTVAGAGGLIAHARDHIGDDPATLRQNVTSPKGTTAAALDVLMADGGLQPLVTEAVAAAKKRSEELG